MLQCYTKKLFTGVVILMLLLFKNSYAAIQDTTARPANNTPGWITGTVTSQDARPLKNVKVTIKGNSTSVTTDDKGHFELNAPAGTVLVIKSPNYNVKEIKVGENKDLKIRLYDTYIQSPNKINVLYGTQDAASVLGSISTVYTNQLTTTPASLFVYALPGQLAGLYTQQTSGFTSFNTAALYQNAFGQNFINSTSQNNRNSDNSEIILSLRGQSPITIIDGVQREISSIDPESIESISVLKDALSTMLLGINSSRGILLVTTKRAEIGRTRISFTAETGVQHSLGLPTPLPAYQYAYLYNEAITNDNLNPVYTSTDIALYKDHSDPYRHPDVNWFKTILKDYAPISSYKLNVSGGSAIARYTIGVSYFDQGGIFKTANATSNTNNDLNRYTINSDVSVQVNKNLNVDLQLFGRVQQATEPGSGINSILAAVYTTPNNAYPTFNPNGSFGGTTQFTQNLLSMSQYSGTIANNTNDILANLDLNYNLNSITKGLTIKAKGNVSYQSQNSLDRSLQNSSYIFTTKGQDTSYTAVGTTRAQSNLFNTVFTQRQSFGQIALNYDRQFGKSSLSAILLYDTKSQTSNYDLSAVTTDRALKAAYNYDGKYFLEGALNSSGYNRYPPGHQFGLFYAGGIGWQMAKEDFIKDNFSWISSWKWRATYGKTGNNNIDQYSYYSYVQTYGTSDYRDSYDVGTGRNTQFTYFANAIANPFISWETGNKLDIGADISLFDKHLQLTADYYHDRYSNLLQVRGSNTALLGVPYPFENIGINLYHGEEFTLTYQNHINNFNYFISGNLSVQASKIIYNNEETPLYSYQKTTGLPVSVIFGYQADGFYQTAADAAKGPSYSGYTLQAGDIKLKDLNNDGVIDQFDKTSIGGLKPLVFYGTTVGFNYKGFSLSVILQGVRNRQININNPLTNSFSGLGFLGTAPQGQAFGAATQRWTPETAATALLPRLSFKNDVYNGYNTQFSSFYLRSGDYLRIKNAEIGYNLPVSVSRKLGVTNIRVFGNGENLFTVAGYGGFDPEVSPLAYPIQRVISAGITVKL